MLTKFSDIMKKWICHYIQNRNNPLFIWMYNKRCIHYDCPGDQFIYIQKSMYYFLHASETFSCIIHAYRKCYLSLIWSVSVVLQPAPAKISDGASCNNFKIIIVIYEKCRQSLLIMLHPFCPYILGLFVDMILRRNIQSCQNQSYSNKICRKVLLLAPVSPTMHKSII